MKTPFSKIAKVRKQKRDTIEKELLKCQNKERMLTHKMQMLYEAIAQSEAPLCGNVSLLVMAHERKRLLQREKGTLQLELEAVQKQRLSLQAAYQSAHVEYEKIHYLEEEALRAMIAKLKKEEQLYLDEISTQLFVNQKSLKAAR